MLSNLQHQLPVSTPDQEKNDPRTCSDFAKLLDVLYRLAIDLGDDVSRAQAALCRGAFFLNGRDFDATGSIGCRRCELRAR